jgi:hypothetical protein
MNSSDVTRSLRRNVQLNALSPHNVTHRAIPADNTASFS